MWECQLLVTPDCFALMIQQLLTIDSNETNDLNRHL